MEEARAMAVDQGGPTQTGGVGARAHETSEERRKELTVRLCAARRVKQGQTGHSSGYGREGGEGWTT